MRKIIALFAFAAFAAFASAQTGSWNALTVVNTLTLPGGTTFTSSGGMLQASAAQNWNFASAATFPNLTLTAGTAYQTLVPSGVDFFAYGGAAIGTLWTDGSANVTLDSNTLANLLLKVGGVTKATLTSTGVAIGPAGSTLSVKSGTNACAGTVTLTAGAGTITSTALDVNTVIVLTLKTASGANAYPQVSTTTNSATITGLATDGGTYNWVALKVN
jgi:hypothetical protein